MSNDLDPAIAPQMHLAATVQEGPFLTIYPSGQGFFSEKGKDCFDVPIDLQSMTVTLDAVEKVLDQSDINDGDFNADVTITSPSPVLKMLFPAGDTKSAILRSIESTIRTTNEAGHLQPFCCHPRAMPFNIPSL